MLLLLINNSVIWINSLPRSFNDLPHLEVGIQILDQSVYFPSINFPYVSTPENEGKLVDNNDSVEEKIDDNNAESEIEEAIQPSPQQSFRRSTRTKTIPKRFDEFN